MAVTEFEKETQLGAVAYLESAQLRDLTNQQVFLSSIEEIRSEDVKPLPDLTPFLNHEGVYTKGLDVQFEGGQVFLGGNFSKYANDEAFPDSLAFKVQSILRIDKEDSKRHVFFGALQAHRNNQLPSIARQVAVTPIVGTEALKDMALHEIGMYQYLGKLGISTLDVVGVALFDLPEAAAEREEIRGFMVTEFEPDLMTMNGLPWKTMSAEEQQQYLDVIADMLATLHSELVFHRDTKFKNFSFGEAQGNFVVSDLEFSLSLKDRAESIGEIARMIKSDFGFVCGGIKENIFPGLARDQRPKGHAGTFEYMREHLFKQYYRRLLEIDGQYLDVLLKAYEVFENQQRAEARTDFTPKAGSQILAL